jgi:acetyl-CoA synthetase
MIPELPVTMLACARIGAVHSVVFAGFSAQALRDRINDSDCKVVVTADGSWRRGSVFPLKEHVDEALQETPSITKALVVKRTENDVSMTEGRDVWWHDVVPGQATECAPEAMDSEDLLYLLYTSGTTGKPKGIMHTTGGYLTQVAYTHREVFDLKPDSDVYWCAADIGWVTGHSYIVYGPLANRATSVLYEGTPNYPAEDRFWEIVERYGVTQLYTAPTAIRAFMKWGDEHPKGHDLSSLRLLGTVGEPINPEAWMWYREVIGGDRCPVVDTWWQTETGAIMISPLPGATTTKPGSATFPIPGISADIVDEKGESVGIPGGGYLTLDQPWPSMLRGIWGDDQRFRDTYWSRFEGRYFAGDGAKRDEDGYFWLLGRVDDVMNVSGTASRPPRSSPPSSATRRSPRQRSSAAPTRRPGRPSPRSSRHAAASTGTTRWPRSCATTSPRSSPPSPSPRRCCSPTTCRRPGRARSCGACSRTSPRTSSSVT